MIARVAIGYIVNSSDLFITLFPNWLCFIWACVVRDHGHLHAMRSPKFFLLCAKSSRFVCHCDDHGGSALLSLLPYSLRASCSGRQRPLFEWYLFPLPLLDQYRFMVSVTLVSTSMLSSKRVTRNGCNRKTSRVPSKLKKIGKPSIFCMVILIEAAIASLFQIGRSNSKECFLSHRSDRIFSHERHWF